MIPTAAYGVQIQNSIPEQDCGGKNRWKSPIICKPCIGFIPNEQDYPHKVCWCNDTDVYKAFQQMDRLDWTQKLAHAQEESIGGCIKQKAIKAVKNSVNSLAMASSQLSTLLADDLSHHSSIAKEIIATLRLTFFHEVPLADVLEHNHDQVVKVRDIIEQYFINKKELHCRNTKAKFVLNHVEYYSEFSNIRSSMASSWPEEVLTKLDEAIQTHTEQIAITTGFLTNMDVYKSCHVFISCLHPANN